MRNKLTSFSARSVKWWWFSLSTSKCERRDFLDETRKKKNGTCVSVDCTSRKGSGSSSVCQHTVSVREYSHTHTHERRKNDSLHLREVSSILIPAAFDTEKMIFKLIFNSKQRELEWKFKPFDFGWIQKYSPTSAAPANIFHEFQKC